MTPNIRAVTFDIGGTLIEPFPSVGHIYSQVVHQLGFERFQPEILNSRFIAAWGNKGKFDYSRSAWRQLVNQTFEELIPANEIPFDEIYDGFDSPEVWTEFDDVRPTLSQLRERQIPVGIISNWDERLLPLLGKLGDPPLLSFFNPTAIAISHEIGNPKPHPDIFQHAAQQLDLPPHQILHVGDSAREDIDGAKQCGFNTLFIKRSHKSETTTNSLLTVLDALENPQFTPELNK